MNDKDNYRIFRWVDSSVVKFVSNVHRGTQNESITKDRRRPRINELNKAGVRFIWRENQSRKIRIPGIINDYKHWVLGVDVVDQLIANYRPKLRCRCTWISIMLHCFDVLRVNCYILYHATPHDHKQVDDENI